jgi:serine/threonine-protein kinase
MPLDDWNRIEATFHGAMERPPEERPAFLDAACGADAELRREVETLLAESGGMSNFMESPAGGLSIGR